MALPEFSNSAKPGSANMLNSNGIVEDAELGSADLLSSNYINNSHLISHKNQTNAPPASPMCVGLVKEVKKEGFGKNKKKKIKLDINLKPPTPGSPVTVQSLITIWSRAIGVYYAAQVASGEISAVLTPKQKGAMAQFLWGLDGSDYFDPGDLTEYGPDIVAYCVKNWEGFDTYYGKPKPDYPNVDYFCEFLTGDAVNGWLKADQPQHGLSVILGPHAAHPKVPA